MAASRKPSQRDLQQILAQPLFAGLEPHAEQRLAAAVTVQRIAAGTTFILEGDPEPDALYVLLDGEVATTADDRLLVLQRSTAIIGLLSMLDDAARTASVSAFSDVRIARVPRAAFRDLMRRSRALSGNITQYLARELRSLHRKDADTRARFADHFRSPNARLLPGPWVMRDVELHVFVMVGPKTQISGLLPPGLIADGETLGCWLLTFVSVPELRSLDPSAADTEPVRYSEAAPLVPVFRRDGEFGFYCPEAYPDNYLAIFLGREVFGLPRRIGAVRRGEHEIDLSVDQRLLLRASWQRRVGLHPAEFGALARDHGGPVATFLDHASEALERLMSSEPGRLPLLVRNQVPDVVRSDGDALRIDELLEVPVTTRLVGTPERLEGAALRRFAHDWMLGGRCVGGARLRLDMQWEPARFQRSYIGDPEASNAPRAARSS